MQQDLEREVVQCSINVLGLYSNLLKGLNIMALRQGPQLSGAWRKDSIRPLGDEETLAVLKS